MLPDKEAVEYWAGIATIIGLVFAVAGVWYAAVQFSLARKASSAAAVVPLGDTFRECRRGFFKADSDQERHFHFAELANALETACAISRDNILFGHTKPVLEHYLASVFEIIETSDEAAQLLSKYLETPETWENIVWFLNKHKKTGPRSSYGQKRATNFDRTRAWTDRSR
jgi:hypothetical protein